MDGRTPLRQAPPAMSAGMEYGEELLAEVDEPPDERKSTSNFHPGLVSLFDKASANNFRRRESLLTRQLHSETEHTDEEYMPPRALSTQSTWSNHSGPSTAELTSDDGRSAPSPAISPPLLPTAMHSILPIQQKTLSNDPQIQGQEGSNMNKQADTGAEKSVEAGLGRKRCISFACGAKDKKTPTPAPPAKPEPAKEATASSPPKRKCVIRFVCPSRSTASAGGKEVSTPSVKRAASPSPLHTPMPKSSTVNGPRRSSSASSRGPPKSVKRSPAVVTTDATPTSSQPSRRFSNDSENNDHTTEATRFHEFASSDGESEDWVQESTCHRSRLTVNDTLKKETYLRKACEEVEEEVVEEEDEDELEVEEAEDEADDDNVDGLDLDESEEDEGFRTDDEEGFAESDSEGEDSDGDWWQPAALSTAATSVDNMEKLLPHPRSERALASSGGSISSTDGPQRSFISRPRRRFKSQAVPIAEPAAPVDLPDSTDFVCGTIDEDRPLEQAYFNSMKLREAAKHKTRPQDIDPTFPTSDPEMDEEDDEDLEDPEESQSERMMHGELEELDGDLTARRRGSPRPRSVRRSPPPAARHRSPAPIKRTNTKSPPPPKRNVARSPPPAGKLFGRSPVPGRSPPRAHRMTSPPNTRRASPLGIPRSIAMHVDGLATRSQLTHTASLPRGGFKISKLGQGNLDGDHSGLGNNDYPKRGAIDIVKGLERKRQRRKEKLYQKACAKAAAKGEKAYKVKPGRGAERMREVGLELQRYHGKGQHILSA